MSVRLLVGDVRDRIREIPDSTVDLVVTSPPFLALRKYGDNDAEMGSEGTPADFLDAILELTQEFRRVLTPHGSIAIELGDTYSGSGGAGGDWIEGSGQRVYKRGAVVPDFSAMPDRKGAGWPQSKSLVLVPGLYASSLAYGWNMLNPAHTFDPWRVRNIITWCRPNPPVGALGDKVRPATSYITVACTSPRRWFDLDAVRTVNNSDRMDEKAMSNKAAREAGTGEKFRMANDRGDGEWNPAGAPPLDWWDDTLNPDDPTDHLTIVLPTQPYPGAHYATWPAKLAQRLIEMMCPLRVCTTCGKPSERITERTEEYAAARTAVGDFNRRDPGQGSSGPRTQQLGKMTSAQNVTLGWSDCGHNTWRPGHTLDPFAGSGTTLAVAQGCGRDATGIELYPANSDLIAQRVGMFLEVVA